MVEEEKQTTTEETVETNPVKTSEDKFVSEISNEKQDASDEDNQSNNTEENLDLSAENKEEFQEEKTKINLKPGMTVRIYQKISEPNQKGEEKERVQYFEGIIIARKHGNEAGASITVRKISDGIGVEKIFPINLPSITKIEVKKQAEVRRSKLYFLRKNFKRRLKEHQLDLKEVRQEVAKMQHEAVSKGKKKKK